MTALLGPSGAGKSTLLNALAGRSSRTIKETLESDDCKNARLKNLSGGESKRVSIGVELIGSLKILLLDEPTSGLDSFNALDVMSNIKKFLERVITVLMTLHQPSYQTIKFFDAVFLLSQGYSIVRGPINQYILNFKAAGFEIPEDTNECDFFIELISVHSLSREESGQSQCRIDKHHEMWRLQAKKSHIQTYHDLKDVNSRFSKIGYVQPTLKNEKVHNCRPVVDEKLLSVGNTGGECSNQYATDTASCLDNELRRRKKNKDPISGSQNAVNNFEKNMCKKLTSKNEVKSPAKRC